jgi:hypothetical protein
LTYSGDITAFLAKPTANADHDRHALDAVHQLRLDPRGLHVARQRSANRLVVAIRRRQQPARVNSADGREVLTYIIGCAVPEGTTVVGTDSTGLDYEFFGELGLAPHWIDHELDHNGMGWVSACLFARVNAFDVAVPISMRGPSRALLASADEISSWTLEEGAFYGNYFAPADRPIEWFACRGHDDTTAEDRVCTQPDPANPGKTLCGFNDAGTCYAAHHHSHAACIGFDQHDGGFYVDCPIDEHHGWVFERDGHDHDDGDDHGDGHGETVVHQVITTYVHP